MARSKGFFDAFVKGFRQELTDAISPARSPAAAAAARALSNIEDTWSRPRSIARLLEALGLEVPQRLSSKRLGELLALLAENGIEAQLADGTALTTTSPSPGIDAKLRLRRRIASSGAQGWWTPATPATAWQPPPVVTEPPRPPAGGPTTHPSARLPPDEANFQYEIAKLRLQFLTAVPSVDRLRQANWPGAFLFAACRSLQLPAHAEQMLRTISTTFAFGHHDPRPIVLALAAHLAPEDWQSLLADLALLNAGHTYEVTALAELVARVAGHSATGLQGAPAERPVAALAPAIWKREAASAMGVASAETEPRAEPPPQPAPPPATSVPTVAQPRGAQEPAVAAPQVQTGPIRPPVTSQPTVSQEPINSESNVRDLGALSDMFD